jgi:hypothetical protein
MYQKFIVQPKEQEAADEMFAAQQNFQQAVDGTKSDSLFNLLKGSEGNTVSSKSPRNTLELPQETWPITIQE